jgi:hypothetical protein
VQEKVLSDLGGDLLGVCTADGLDFGLMDGRSESGSSNQGDQAAEDEKESTALFVFADRLEVWHGVISFMRGSF